MPNYSCFSFLDNPLFVFVFFQRLSDTASNFGRCVMPVGLQVSGRIQSKERKCHFQVT